MRDVLIYDIETDSLDVEKAKVKWFGAYSFYDEQYYLLDETQTEEIKKLLRTHRVLVGFNNKEFDNPILENNGYDLKYKVIVDLFEISAPKGNGGYGKYNKNKLAQMGVKDLGNYKLKTIIETLKLDDANKGDIDYKIFQKKKLTTKEIIEIKKYLKQDLILTKKLFEWYEEQFEPLKKFLSPKSQSSYKHIKSSLASLSYEIICNKAGLKVEWDDKKKATKSFSGGHHIDPRWNKIKGNIVNIDFTSAYPHSLMMGNLYSPSNKGWNGNLYFDIEGNYNNKSFGKIESALRDIFLERLKAKKSGDKIKSQAYKIIINSLYGLTGNPIFKTLYNPTTASDCTHIVRTWLKKLSKKIEVNGFKVLYGFTDNIIVQIPNYLNEEILMLVVDKFIEEVKSNMPFPQDTFGMDVETRMKFIWFVAKNCYLYVDDKNEVKYKSTLLNKNTPKAIMKLFETYMKPKIVKQLNINFTEKELINQIVKILKTNIHLAGEEYRVGELNSYKVKTSLQYQISKVYDQGTHYLIPNKAMIGIGKAKGTLKKKPVRYCSIEEFKKNNLKIEDIELNKLLQHLKPFIENKQIKQEKLK